MIGREIENLIDRLAEEKAAKMKTLSKATVVMMMIPEWMRAEEVNALFGLPLNQLYQLAKTGKIAAKKTDPMNRNSAVIFKTQDIRAIIGDMTDYSQWANERPDLDMKEAQ